MIRSISSVALALAVSFGAAAAHAQAPGGFGTSGQLVIGAERLFGFVSDHQSQEREEGGVTTRLSITTSQFALLGLHGTSPYTHPRFGIDYFVTDNISVGGALAFVTTSSDGESETAGVTTSGEGPSTTGFLFAPRAGYALMFSDVFGIWPRAGFTYYSRSVDPPGPNEDSDNGLALTLEGLLVISPAAHIGFTVGPTLDFGFTGGLTQKDAVREVEWDRSITDIGIQAGMIVWF